MQHVYVHVHVMLRIQRYISCSNLCIADSKWQDLPPEYAEVLQNSQNQANQQQ